MELSFAFQYTTTAIVSIVLIVLYLIRGRLLYWKKRGVPHDEPSLLFGNMKGLGQTKHFFELIRQLYAKHKGSAPFCGLYFYYLPVVIPLDLDLIKRILIKDFNNFVDRGVYHNERDDPLSGHLFALDGYKWHQLRSKLTPTFTSGKMKFMFPTVVDVGHRFAKVFGEMVSESSVVEVKDILARFTTDVISTCAFGIECNSLRDPDAEFRKVGQTFFNTSRHNAFVRSFTHSCPNLARALRLRTTPDGVSDFFLQAVRDTVEYREKNGIIRNDFMNMLIELKNRKTFTTEKGEVITGLTMEELAAQAFVFYLGGFETSSTTMGFALYELALNQDIQDRLRNEVIEVLENHNGVVTYESMMDMHYMDQVIYETLRKYTILMVLNRKTKEDYIVPDTNLKIDKGTSIFIPADAIHHDPEIYPNPDVFDPERFTPEAIQKRDPIAWLPFGDGPRNCIGLRFGKMQGRIGLTLLLKSFKFHIADQMKVPIEFDLKGKLLSSKSGIYLRVEAI